MLTGYELTVACLALNIYHEAAYEPIKGKQAVALVTINRATKQEKDICKVVFAPKQFSWTAHARDGNGKLFPTYRPTNNPRWREAKEVARIVLSGEVKDFTAGATHYHATYIRKPYWVKAFEPAGKYGQHLFYR